jgi:hypothetical protein
VEVFVAVGILFDAAISLQGFTPFSHQVLAGLWRSANEGVLSSSGPIPFETAFIRTEAGAYIMRSFKNLAAQVTDAFLRMLHRRHEYISGHSLAVIPFRAGQPALCAPRIYRMRGHLEYPRSFLGSNIRISCFLVFHNVLSPAQGCCKDHAIIGITTNEDFSAIAYVFEVVKVTKTGTRHDGNPATCRLVSLQGNNCHMPATHE